MHLKKEVLRVHAENLLLESYLEPESAIDDLMGELLDPQVTLISPFCLLSYIQSCISTLQGW